METIQIAAFIIAIVFLFTFVSTFRFYRRRIRSATSDQRKAIRPTLYMSISFLVAAIGNFITFFAINYSFTYVWAILIEIALPLFGFCLLVAVVAALKMRKLYILPLAMLALSYFLSLLSPGHPLDDPYLTTWITVQGLLLAFPVILFGYLWRTTRRPTTFGMFAGTLIYVAYSSFIQFVQAEYVGVLGFYYVPAEYPTHVAKYAFTSGFVVGAMAIAVFGLSLVYWCFKYSDRELGIEVIGYSLAIPVFAAEAAIIWSFWGVPSPILLTVFPVEYLTLLLLVAIAIGIFLLTGSYLYGRYRENRSRQTLMLSGFSYVAGLSFLLYNIGEHMHYFYYGAVPILDLITLPAGMITAGFLFLSAIYALEWKSLAIVPPIVIVPLVVAAIVWGIPLPSWLFFGMIAAAIAMTILPTGMFAGLWLRMRKANEKGRGRVLGILLGFLFVLVASPLEFIPMVPSGDLIRVLGGSALLAGSLLFYFGVSGRIDRWFYQRRT